MSDKSEAVVDVSLCAQEPIHIPGAIQTHGCLFACAMPSWSISHVSENLGEVMGVGDSARLLGESIDTLLDGHVVHDLRNVLQSSMVSGVAETLANVQVEAAGVCDLTVHLSGDHAVIEVLPRGDAVTETSSPLTIARSMIGRLKRAATFERMLTMAASQVRAVTGFDRVMIYKFLEDGSGQVLAEAVRSGLTPFLGLHYPASDIPAQARELYKRQTLRLIPDVNYTPSRLLAASAARSPLDLSLATLRGVSPIHLEYLHNMGSAATLTISIVVGNRLWGLIACHHQVPRRLAVSTCSACDLFGQVFSLQIETRDQARELAYISNSREAHERLIASMPPEETIFDNLARYKDLLTDLVPADGVGIWTTGVFSGVGVLPPVEAMPALVAFLSQHDAHSVYITDGLGAVYPPAVAFADRVSGIIAIPFSRAPRDFLLFFRREVLQVVDWGGNPDKAVELSPDGLRIGPRKSFATWRQEVKGQSRPWLPSEAKIAEALRVSLLDVILRRSDLMERERRAAQESQALLVAELNHRVKNILALIQSLVRQSRHGAASITAFTSDLESRIRALALAHDQMTLRGWSWAPLRQLLEAEAAAWMRTSRQGLAFEGPPALVDPRAYQTLALVFHELMTNAAKYGAISTPQGRLTVRWSFDERGAMVIEWIESGGPAVQAPTRRGFGSLVVEQTVPFELQGEAEVRFVLEGVRARFVVPSAHARLGEEDDAVIETSHAEVVFPLQGKRILLVEDSMMIALDAQSALQDLGVTVELSGTASDATRVIARDRFDYAVLDINLSGETSFGVAAACVASRLPFIFATGYGESVVIPERFRSVPVVSKPYDEHALRVALQAAQAPLQEAQAPTGTA